MSSISDGGNHVPAMLLVFSVVFSILPTIAVALRFQAAGRIKSRLYWDDWAIIISLIGTITTAILIIIGVAAGGMGQHIKRDANNKPIYDAEYVILQRMLALGPTKVSVLLLYRRIFSQRGRAFNIISISLIVLVIMWTIAFFITNAEQYTPVYAMWTMIPSEAAAHSNFKQTTQMFLAQSYIDIALDVLIISLPIPLVWKLQMKLRRKLQVSVVFLLGALTTAASVARTAVQYGVAVEYNSKNPDKTYFLAPIIYWPLIEAALGIIAACLPLLRPVSQIYNLRNIMSVSSKAISAVFTASARSSQKSSRGPHSDVESGPPSRHEDNSKDDKWMKPYDISALEKTIDHQSQIETRPTSGKNDASSDGIELEREYNVTYAEKAKVQT